MTTLLKEQTKKTKAPSVANGNGANAQSLNALANTVYPDERGAVKDARLLAQALTAIENALQASQGWLHVGPCTCDQCLYELDRQRRLIAARHCILAKMATVADGAEQKGSL